LLERAAALRLFDNALLRRSESSGQVLLIDGPAGIGKTRLVAVARVRAEAAGVRVLVARGGELEVDFAFGVVRQLFEATLITADNAAREALFGSSLFHVGRPRLSFPTVR